MRSHIRIGLKVVRKNGTRGGSKVLFQCLDLFIVVSRKLDPYRKHAQEPQPSNPKEKASSPAEKLES